MRFPWPKRKVIVDSNVLISGIVYKSEQANKAIDKSCNVDDLQMTNVIRDECLAVAGRGKHRITRKQMEKELDSIAPNVIDVKIPPKSTLKKKYWIRDENDYKILYSAEVTGSEILITGDNDFLDPKMKGPKNTIVMKPKTYLKEIRIFYPIKKRLERRRRK